MYYIPDNHILKSYNKLFPNIVTKPLFHFYNGHDLSQNIERLFYNKKPFFESNNKIRAQTHARHTRHTAPNPLSNKATSKTLYNRNLNISL